MTTGELAAWLQMPMSSRNDLVADEKALGQKDGHWRFHKTAIDAWLTARKRDARISR